MASTFPSRDWPAPSPDPFQHPGRLDGIDRVALACLWRVWRLGRSTSTTLTPAARSRRTRPAPYDPVPSTPTRSIGPTVTVHHSTHGSWLSAARSRAARSVAMALTSSGLLSSTSSNRL